MLWVLATNAGLFPGLALGQTLAGTLSEPSASGVVSLSFAIPVGLLQWLVLRRHLGSFGSWVLSTSAGWGIGAFLGSALMLSIAPSVAPGGLFWALALGFISGAAVGLAQLPLILRYAPALAPWWIIISAFAWAALFPGAITGLFLAREPRVHSD